MFKKLKKTVKFYQGLEKKSYLMPSGTCTSKAGGWKIGKNITAYSTSAYVYICVKKRSEKVGELLEFGLKTKDGKEIEDSPWLDLLNQPNTYQNKNEFWELYQTFKDLTGSAFIYELKLDGNEIPKELHLLRPDKVTLLFDKTGSELIGYKYQTEHGGSVTYPPEDVISSFYPNPLAQNIGLGGMSPLTPGQKSVDTEEQLTDYHYSVLKNGGKIEGMFVFKTEFLSKDQQDQLKESFSSNYADAKNSGKPLMLSEGTEYHNLGLTPTELSYLESKKLTREDILAIYSVPKTVIGMTEGVQKGNYEEANSIFIKDTIAPLMWNIEQKLDQFLLPEYLELYIANPVPEDIEMKLKVIDSGTKNFYMTTNEKREKMGLDPIQGLDEVLIPFNMLPSGEPEKESSVKKKACC